MKERVGQISENKKTGQWIARVCYKNSTGKRTAIQRKAESKADARRILKQLLETLENGGRKSIDVEKLMFGDLIKFYEKYYAKPAKFIDNRKVEGLRDLGRVKGFLKQFKDYFGKMKLRQITYGDILIYRNKRLMVHTHYKRVRTIATMNRELSYLRRVFNIAIREGWILRNPVNSGESLIDISAERRRERILSLDEEKRLLAACTGRREYLKSLIICLLSTGARIGETLKLKWSDINFESRLITFEALNTKTLKTRKVAMTNQLNDELLILWDESDKKLSSFVFKMRCVKGAFKAACDEAKIETGRPFGITLHSLRHTAATRLVKGSLPIQMVGRILGHTNPQTTYRYLSANDATLYEAAAILDSIQQSSN